MLTRSGTGFGYIRGISIITRKGKCTINVDEIVFAKKV
jgi:hypothetical protein